MVERSTPFERSEVIRALSENEYTRVTFYKLNGDLREMLCTLNLDQMQLLIQTDDDVAEAFGGRSAYVSVEGDLEYDANQVRVFDVEAKDWRSFLLTNLVTFEGVNT